MQVDHRSDEHDPNVRHPFGTMSIVADDLTGAADALAALCRSGSVALDLETFSAEASDIAAVDLDARDASVGVVELAYRRSVPLALTRGTRQVRWLVCKIDSRLRGPVETAVSTLCASVTDRPTVVCSALPEENRSIIEGQFIDTGVPVINLSRRLGACGLDPVLVPLVAVRNRQALRHHLETAAAGTCLIVDAETRSDLDALADCLMAMSRPPALACSSGLLRSLSLGAEPPALPRLASQGVVWIIGSPLALTEIEELDVERVRADHTGTLSEAKRRDVVESLHVGRPILVAGPDAHPAATLDSAVAHRLSESLPPEVTRAAAIVASGGATARAVLKSLQINRLDVVGEILPGAPVALTSAPCGDLLVVLRSGGFRNAAPLAGIAQHLKSLLAENRLSEKDAR